MHQKHRVPASITVALVLIGLLAWPVIAQSPTASTVTGQATGVQATVLGILGTATTTTLADTGTLADTSDARDASLDTGSVPSLLAGEEGAGVRPSAHNGEETRARLEELRRELEGIVKR